MCEHPAGAGCSVLTHPEPRSRLVLKCASTRRGGDAARTGCFTVYKHTRTRDPVSARAYQCGFATLVLAHPTVRWASTPPIARLSREPFGHCKHPASLAGRAASTRWRSCCAHPKVVRGAGVVRRKVGPRTAETCTLVREHKGAPLVLAHGACAHRVSERSDSTGASLKG